jgi:hypothetical protein
VKCGGGNLGNSSVIQSEPTPAHGRPHRLSLVLHTGLPDFEA